MAFDWVFLSLLSAFGQALGWSLKKKTLERKGVNNLLGAVSFFVAGVFLLFLYVAVHGTLLPVLSARFFVSATIVIVTNIIAVVAAYQALDRAPLSLLMPFVAISALAIIPVEWIARGILPQGIQVVGIFLLILGAITITLRQIPDKEAMKALGYFSITVMCYAIAPPFMGIAVEEAQSELFSAAIFHLVIAFGFVPLVFLSNEMKAVAQLRKASVWKRTLLLMIASGAVIALLENGPATLALASAKASEVFSLKRTMPLFALLFGVLFFQEIITKRHLVGTSLLVIGSVLIVWFRV